MVNPNSSARDDADGIPANGTNPARPNDENTPISEPAVDAAGEHTAGADKIPHPTTDEIFAELVAGLTADDSGSHPDDTDLDHSAPTNSHETDRTGRAADDTWGFPVAPWVQGSGPRDRVVTSQVANQQEQDESFVPPNPRDVLSKDPVRNLAWVAVVAAPVMILLALIFWPDSGSLVAQISGLSFLAGLAALLWRMPKSKNPLDDDPGAVV